MYITLDKAKSEEWRRIEDHGCSCDLGDKEMIRVGVKEVRVLKHSSQGDCGLGI